MKEEGKEKTGGREGRKEGIKEEGSDKGKRNESTQVYKSGCAFGHLYNYFSTKLSVQIPHGNCYSSSLPLALQRAQSW